MDVLVSILGDVGLADHISWLAALETPFIIDFLLPIPFRCAFVHFPIHAFPCSYAVFFPVLPCYNSYCRCVQFYPFYSGDPIYLSFAGDEAICFSSPKEHDSSFLSIFLLSLSPIDKFYLWFLYFRALHRVYWITSLR